MSLQWRHNGRDGVSKITSLTIVYSTVYSFADQRKHQSSASLTFVRGIHRWPVNSPHKRSVTRKMFPFDDVTMAPIHVYTIWTYRCWTSIDPYFQDMSCSHVFRSLNQLLFMVLLRAEYHWRIWESHQTVWNIKWNNYYSYYTHPSGKLIHCLHQSNDLVKIAVIGDTWKYTII